jgi:hypothetical protein
LFENPASNSSFVIAPTDIKITAEVKKTSPGRMISLARAIIVSITTDRTIYPSKANKGNRFLSMSFPGL